MSNSYPFNSRQLLTALVLCTSSNTISATELNTDLYNGDHNAVEDKATTIVITSGRFEQPLDQVIASTSVITKDDIERKQYQTITDALTSLPGVAIRNNGGAGKATSLFLRGTNSDHILVLVDGVRVGSATLGTFAFEQFSLANIERIEVARGPFSSLYGMDAIGGVIQIFTKPDNRNSDSDSPQSRATLQLSSGNYSSSEQSIALSYNDSQVQIQANLSGSETDGFDALENSDTDEDGAEIESSNISMTFHNGKQQSLTLNWLKTQSDVEYDTLWGGADLSSNEQQIWSTQLKQRFTDNWDSEWTIGHSEDSSETFDEARTTGSLFETKRESFSVINRLEFSDSARTTFGIDYLKDKINSSSDYVENSRENLALFLGQMYTRGKHTLELSGRLDDNEQFDRQTTGSIRWALDLTPSTRFSLSRGTAFKAPTFNDLYFPSGGNPDLSPERSGTTEIGLQFSAGISTQISSFLYETEIDNLITWIPAPTASNPFRYSPFNMDSSKIVGWETSLQSQWNNGLQLVGHITLQDPKNKSEGSDRDNLLIARPRYLTSIDLSKAFARWQVGINLEAASKRFNDAGNQVELPGYGLLNARVSFRPQKAIQLRASVDNIADKQYQTSFGYNQPGRTLLFTAIFSFDSSNPSSNSWPGIF